MIYLGHIKYMNCAIMEELEETGAAGGGGLLGEVQVVRHRLPNKDASV